MKAVESDVNLPFSPRSKRCSSKHYKLVFREERHGYELFVLASAFKATKQSDVDIAVSSYKHITDRRDALILVYRQDLLDRPDWDVVSRRETDILPAYVEIERSKQQATTRMTIRTET